MKKAQPGFTLAELLVVVAILGILTAVSIPLYNGLTEASKEKTDNNYVAVVKTAYMAEYDSFDETLKEADSFAGSTQYYDLANHEFYTVRTGIKAYGQGTAAGEVSESHVGKIIACTYEDGEVQATWTSAMLATVEDESSNLLLKTTQDLIDDYIAMKMQKNNVIDSGNTSSARTQTVMDEIKKTFPDTTVTAWRVTKETDNDSAYTITVTDVDINSLTADGKLKVKVIRYNPSKNTYTAAYILLVQLTDTNGNKYNALNINSDFVLCKCRLSVK